MVWLPWPWLYEFFANADVRPKFCPYLWQLSSQHRVLDHGGVGRNTGVGAARAHGASPVRVSQQAWLRGQHIRFIRTVPNEAFQPTRVYFSPR